MQMNSEEYWQLKIKGKDSEDIHGISLRERVREIASKMNENGIGIKGEVRNIKKDGSVEVTCQAENENHADEFFDKIKNIEDPLIKGKIDRQESTKTRVIYEPEGPRFGGFQIRREDELTEMVWALQGAGKVFSQQEGIRETKRKNSLDRALKHGLTVISNCAEELQSNKSSRRLFVLSAIDNYIKECPSKDEDAITNLYDLYQTCEQANTLVADRAKNNEKELNEHLTKIARLCPEIDEKIKTVK